MDKITTSSITKNLGIPFGRLREWIVRGYIHPSFPSPGQGQAAEFTKEDVFKVKAFQHMIDRGLTRETAAEYIKAIDENFPFQYFCEAIVFTRTGEGVKATLAMVTETLKTSKKYDGPLSGSLPDMEEDWDDVYILNFRKIQESVDRAFRR